VGGGLIVMEQGTLFAIPKPEEAGVTCRACGGAASRTFWAMVDGLRLLRLDCAACGRMVRHLGPDNLLSMPSPLDVPFAAKRLPGSSCRWLGLVRGTDGVWLAVALAEDLKRCWDTLLTCSIEGDRLCTPVRAAEPRKGEFET
jgi:hypothetical protein